MRELDEVYYEDLRGEQQGPVSVAQFTEDCREKKVTAEANVWYEGKEARTPTIA